MASRKTATTDPLARYRDKRDFAATPEPKGRVAPRRKQLAFVVQKHAARRLHYDFRLELDGTLKSWAVPKGPSLDPQVKRMAVEVEDHPLSYADFEGSIPPGHYGAGTVIVWDQGHWQPHGDDPAADYAAGKLKFGLSGHKLHGDWTLVRMKGREGERQTPWLLIKERDDAARPEAEYDLVAAEPDSVKGLPAPRAAPAGGAPGKPARRGKTAAAPLPELPAGARKAALPEALSPALATLVDRVPAHGRWSYEVKFDGYRLLARIDARGGVRLFTRNGHDWTARMPKLAEAAAALALHGSWLDGEIVLLGAGGVPDFQALQNAFDASGRALDALRYYVFDLPFLAGHDLRRVPLEQRRGLLQALLAARSPADGALRYSADFEVPGDTARLLAAACQLGLEGVIGKRSDAAYSSGRSRDWIKLKCALRQEFVIGGYTDPQGSRTGLGALLLGYHAREPGAGRRKLLRYAGNVGTGFDGRTLADLHARLAPLERAAPAFDEPTGQRRVHWVEPRLVCEVAFAEWTGDGRVRHAVFKGLRDDKPAIAIVREQPVHAPAAASEHPAAASARRSAAPAVPPAGRRLTHPERVVDAASGLTKGDLFAYYDRVAPLILPHLADRPVALLRAPDGIGAGMFFQKHADARQLPGVRLLDPALDSGNQPLLAIDTAAALLGVAQMNAIELHTWNARARAIEQPDRMVFDLDPGEGVAWRTVCEAARIVRELLEALGLASDLKTSGGKGLHVVVPLKPELGWDAVKGFSQALVQHLARHAPERFVAKSGPKNRVGRIFVDYLRNGRGATTVAAFSARARPGLGISLPLDWSELPALTRRDAPPAYDIRTPQPRLAEAAQAWPAAARRRQTLTKAMRALAPKPSEQFAEAR